ADKEVWEAMKKSYTELELKRAAFIQENSQKVDYEKLHKMLNTNLRKDLREIHLLEADLIIDYISDLFVGELTVYQKTLPKLHEMLNDYLRDDLREIRLLEADLINDDISDPFGGELSVYQKTLAELDEQIDLLIDKLKRQS